MTLRLAEAVGIFGIKIGCSKNCQAVSFGSLVEKPRVLFSQNAVIAKD